MAQQNIEFAQPPRITGDAAIDLVAVVDYLWTFYRTVFLQGGLQIAGTTPILPSYTVATLPVAAAFTRGLIYVSDEAGGAVPAFSDGVAFRRVTDRAIVS